MGRRWQLVGGDVTITDGLVLRPVRPWTGAVHALLAHLRAQGLDCVPEPVGVRHDVEAVRYIEGDCGAGALQHQVDLAGVASATRLLRRIHDATHGFDAPDGTEWAFPPVPGADAVCHGDPGPWNFVWRDGEAVALIDWDHASPGPAMDDVAYLADTFAPFRPDDVAMREHGFPSPPDRVARIREITAAYGVGRVGLVDRVIDRQQLTADRVVDLADRGLEPWASWVREGMIDDLRGRARWTREHRHLVE